MNIFDFHLNKISVWLGNNYLNGRSYPHLSLLQYGIFAYWEAGGNKFGVLSNCVLPCWCGASGEAVVSLSSSVHSVSAFLSALCSLKCSLSVTVCYVVQTIGVWFYINKYVVRLLLLSHVESHYHMLRRQILVCISYAAFYFSSR